VKETLGILVLFAGLGACATYTTGASAPAQVESGVLVDAKGMTLYTFDKDPAGAGKSVCVAQCAKNWPPLAAGADAKPTAGYAVIMREDGTRQWTYKGNPLYLWVKDEKPGDRTGDGFNNLWRVARP